MNTPVSFYICPHYFYASDSLDEDHEHALLRVDAGLPGDERRKPITDQQGNILSAAPRWFHEAILDVKLIRRRSL